MTCFNIAAKLFFGLNTLLIITSAPCFGSKGVFSLREVKDFYLEPSGASSLKKFPEYSEVTLNYCGKNMAWLYEELGKKGYTKLKDILYAEWTENDGFYIKTY